ncbi:MAG TPA: hypothetical protein VN699_11420 [Pirellulales bacterium]|nr:hypothetical protein [Pirellulales bacterium]
MDEPRFQFSLRAIFGVTVLAAVLLLFVTAPKTIPIAIAGICGAVPGAVLARLTGRDMIDAAFGAVFGFVAGATFFLAIPDVN